VLGSDEAAAGVATGRDMQTHDQVQVSMIELAGFVAERVK
jgi:histidyl-tRNA synthetase